MLCCITYWTHNSGIQFAMHSKDVSKSTDFILWLKWGQTKKYLVSLTSAQTRGYQQYFVTIASSSTPREYQESELEELSSVLRWPRGCFRGQSRKRPLSFRTWGYPYVKGSAAAIN